MRTVRNIARELAATWKLAANLRSFLRLAGDVFLYRVLRVLRPPGFDALRTVQLDDGVHLTYRLNRGDLLTLREVWIDEVYRFPRAPASADRMVDLGANIGLASVWFAVRYGVRRVVAVEPLTENVELLRRNLDHNGIEAVVIEGAVGVRQGAEFFARSHEPNSGQLADSGLAVRPVSMHTVLHAVGDDGPIDLMKVDVEGAEEALFSGDLGWLDRVQVILAEIHRDLADGDRITATIEAAGLSVASPRSVRGDGAVTAFVRQPAAD